MALAELDKQHLWHPFTQMSEWVDSNPLVIERGDGNHLIDTEGNRYLDGVSSLWVNVHGHNHPEINKAISEQLSRIAHSTLLGLTNGPAAELAARLCDVAPDGLSKVFYSDSGSTAVEIALKQAFQYWQLRGVPAKTQFVHLDQAYHGDTLGAVGVGGIGLFHEVFGPLIRPGHRVASPALVGLDAALASLEEQLEHSADSIAAFIVEPLVQGAAGMLTHPAGYLHEAAALCRRHDVLVIADEVATGFGRTGTLFACEQEGVSPDFLCLAKGLTAGYLPLAATLSTDEIYSAFLGHRAEKRTFFHGHTYTGNPLACAAALANLRVFERNEVLAKLPAKIARLESQLAEQVFPSPAVGEIRQCGMMVGIELSGFDPVDATGVQVCALARKHGVLLRPLGDVVVLMPPLSITIEEIDQLVTAVAAAIDELA